LPPNVVAITVDDGFGDFLTNAQPVFSRYGIPSTVLVVTDFLDRKSWPWFSKIEYMVARTRCHYIKSLGRDVMINDERLRLAVRMVDALTELTNIERMAEMEFLESQLGIEVPPDPPLENEALSWDEVRRLAAEGSSSAVIREPIRFFQDSRASPNGSAKLMARSVALDIDISHALSGWNRVERPRPPMHHEVKKKLQREFEAKVQELSNLVERDLSGWLRS